MKNSDKVEAENISSSRAVVLVSLRALPLHDRDETVFVPVIARVPVVVVDKRSAVKLHQLRSSLLVGKQHDTRVVSAALVEDGDVGNACVSHI